MARGTARRDRRGGVQVADADGPFVDEHSVAQDGDRGARYVWAHRAINHRGYGRFVM